MLDFEFLENGLGLVSSLYFVHDFSRKIFILLYSINWLNFIVWLLLIFEILGNTWILIICFPLCDVSYQAIFNHDLKSQNKNLSIFRIPESS